MRVSPRAVTFLIAAIFLTLVTVKATTWRNNEYNSRDARNFSFGLLLFFSLFFFSFLQRDSEYISSSSHFSPPPPPPHLTPRALVGREQMPLDDRGIFSVVTISVLGTSKTKRNPSTINRVLSKFFQLRISSLVSRDIARTSQMLCKSVKILNYLLPRVNNTALVHKLNDVPHNVKSQKS